jgi:hypothetical protein
VVGDPFVPMAIRALAIASALQNLQRAVHWPGSLVAALDRNVTLAQEPFALRTLRGICAGRGGRGAGDGSIRGYPWLYFSDGAEFFG